MLFIITNKCCLLKLIFILGIFESFEQVIRYNLVWGSLRLINRKEVYESANCSKTGLQVHV